MLCELTGALQLVSIGFFCTATGIWLKCLSVMNKSYNELAVQHFDLMAKVFENSHLEQQVKGLNKAVATDRERLDKLTTQVVKLLNANLPKVGKSNN
jgi:hypothetical protein